MDSDVRQICERPRQLAVFVSKVDFFAWQKGSKTSLLKKATAEDAGPIFENDTPVKSRFSETATCSCRKRRAVSTGRRNTI